VTSEGQLGPWDVVVVVPFPYSDQLAEKRRPALIVSNERLHAEGFIWIAMITSAGKAQRPGDIAIDDLNYAGLPGASIIRTVKLATIEPARVRRVAGSLRPSERAAVMRALQRFLAT
jgi:mRNA interferase MazF